ncbi:hypothetical protein BKG82_13025 [Mycobacteroides chelonae]|uniref:FtsK domain-containing protein n=1 Tax=Mycobacteroides chelonae TaxID=1774 RepID=A0A1S1LS45_MYCCH|nr:hypothetical protein [Mycobacteroides chelonae]OHU57106.1 hypothetical protein BKG82_13025 [Mycobacteroides chelonae]
MTSATNRTERLAKALKESRPDFTLHNARVFARSIIEAPEDAFGAKPLTYLPQDQSQSHMQRSNAVTPGNKEKDDRPADPASLTSRAADRAWNRLPHAATRPQLPENQTRQTAIESWPTTKFALGVDAKGDQASWSPAATHALAVIGQYTTGKTTLAQSLLDQARALGWIALHATVGPDETNNPRDNPGLLVSSPPFTVRKGSGTNTTGYNIVVEFAHRLLRHRRASRTSRTQPLPSSNIPLTDLGGTDVPVLIVLDEVDLILSYFKGSPGDQHWIMNAINEILTLGRELRVHIVLVANPRRRDWLLPGILADNIGSVVLAGQPDRETVRLLSRREAEFSLDLRGHCGRMALVQRQVNDAGDDVSEVSPFQAYIGGAKLSAVPGQYPRLALVTGQDPQAEKISFSVLNKLPDVLLDRQVGDRWEPDPEHRHLDLWGTDQLTTSTESGQT